MRPSRLLALACASLAASIEPYSSIGFEFDEGCVKKVTLSVSEAIWAREHIASIAKVAGKCENVMVIIEYKMDEISRCESTDGSFVAGAALGGLLNKQLAELNYTGDVLLRKATIKFDGEVIGDCRMASISGTGDSNKECTDLTRTPYAMKSSRSGTHTLDSRPGVTFDPSNESAGVKFADLAVKANFGEDCQITGKASQVELQIELKMVVESTVGVRDVTIVFPDQPDCAPRGCDAIIGTKGVQACLENARAIENCQRAIYHRTYLNLGSGQCDPAVPGKLHLNMDLVLADDKALDSEDKRTVVTSVSFGQERTDTTCTDTTLSFSNSCSDTLSAKSTLKQVPIDVFTFTGEELITADAVATNYTVTTTCNSIHSWKGDEVIVNTEFTIPHKLAASQSRKASGSFARLQVGGLLTAAALTLALRSL